MKSIAAALAATVAFTSVAAAAPARPPAISWDWYKAGVAHLHYTDRSPDDAALAAHYFRMSADRGNASAAYKLGETYENGSGIARDLGRALEYYLMAARTGDKYGEFRVGWFYEHGLGMPKDLGKAAHWYNLAARHGNEWAFQMLGFMLADGNGVEKNEKLARQYLAYSVSKTHDNWAEWKLATLIEKQQPARARRLLAASAKAGNPEARKMLLRRQGEAATD